jgi:hypothetical protein
MQSGQRLTRLEHICPAPLEVQLVVVEMHRAHSVMLARDFDVDFGSRPCWAAATQPYI